jgi:ABC-2 type transport system permease protein
MISESVRLQLIHIVRRPGQLAPLIVTPLYSLVFFAVARTHGASAATVTALALTATTMALWGHTVFVASEVLEEDRYAGTLELLMTASDRYRLSVIVRVLTASSIGVFAFVEVLLVGWVAYRIHPHIEHVVPFVVALLVVSSCAGATAVLLSVALLLTRAARTMQNAITYPAFILSGMLLPRRSLPEPVRLASDCLPLSWAIDALRSAAIEPDSGTAWTYIAVALVLCAVLLAIGGLALSHVLGRLRQGGIYHV